MRLQILHLPAPADEYPFALILDECDAAFFDPADELDAVGERLGARGIIAFTETVEVL